MLRELMSLNAVPPEQPTRMRAAAAAVAGFLGASGDDIVFVDNATAGVNAVLRSLRLEAGDEIVVLDQAYGAVARTAAFVAREHGAKVVTVPLPFPMADAWAFAPRGCCVLWAGTERHEGLHPSVISWGLDVGWHQEFDWTGTRDPTPLLCAPAGIAFMTEFLGLQAMRDYNHALAWSAAQRLCTRFGQPWVTPEDMIGCMATVPLPTRLGSTAADAALLKDWLLFERRIEVPIIARGERLWARASAQVYNDGEDVERLAAAVDEYGLR